MGRIDHGPAGGSEGGQRAGDAAPTGTSGTTGTTGTAGAAGASGTAGTAGAGGAVADGTGTGTDTVRSAAAGYWERRGMPTVPGQVAVAPGSSLLLLAVLAAQAAQSGEDEEDEQAGEAGGALRTAAGRRTVPGPGAVFLPRPCSRRYARQARLLGRAVHTVPVPVECGGVPDPFALLEAVRRARTRGTAGRPGEPGGREQGPSGVLVLSVADDVTGTTVPPELLHEVCEAAAEEGLLLVSDETWRDTSHRPHDTVVVSPAEMLHGSAHADAVVVLTGLNPAGPVPLPPGAAAGAARFPATGRGARIGARTGEVLAALGAGLSRASAAAAAAALAESAEVRERRAAAARLHGARADALHRAVTAAGAVCRPPHVGRGVYADFEQLRSRLAARGIRDAPALEAELVRGLAGHRPPRAGDGPGGTGVLGGHRFGDDPHALRVRLATDLLAGARGPGHTPETEPAAFPEGADLLELPGAAQALTQVQSVLADLTDGSSH
ncbi:aminotransferase class I/II-fold pyridoxal phosphate-dependent enzyme [Streptomyces sp. NRRL F-5053]|uniref:aminotransferase class I/II-fold pyridoxal phosphate-dependent enzyme n=1 Tax=Streptomyces sp. NRRL F-5053 TaxID=1463854 RepID=UPI000AA83FF2|nr:aminotransferase class I/II-fold pyridoxal phosphate-dependent enzyme [Streptomyces sp. NRRL F-5053]